jgi:hypothetical protein
MRFARRALLPLLLLSLSDKRCPASEEDMADKGYRVTANGAAQHPQLFIEDEDELSNICSIHFRIAELRSQVQALRVYVGKELTDLKRDLKHVAACADCLVLSANTDTPSKDTNAANSRGEHLLLPIRTVFNA